MSKAALVLVRRVEEQKAELARLERERILRIDEASLLHPGPAECSEAVSGYLKREVKNTATSGRRRSIVSAEKTSHHRGPVGHVKANGNRRPSIDRDAKALVAVGPTSIKNNEIAGGRPPRAASVQKTKTWNSIQVYIAGKREA